MRAHGVLKESSSPNLCAFCAHRLGQTRRPSHVQRRFLQSTRPTSRPPAEATATREDDSQPSQPSWGRSVPTARPSPVGGGWGRPSLGTGGVSPAGPRLGGGWGKPAAQADSSIPLRRPAPETSNSTASTRKLLPNEQRAKDLMMAKQLERERVAREKATHVDKFAGPGPKFTRSGRPEPQVGGVAEIPSDFPNLSPRNQARETFAAKQALFRNGHVIGEPNIGSGSGGPDKGINEGQWGQLRKARLPDPPEAQSERPPPPVDAFTAGRAQRENEAQFARYTPLRPRETSDRAGSGGGFSIRRTQTDYRDSGRGTFKDEQYIQHKDRDSRQSRYGDNATSSQWGRPQTTPIVDTASQTVPFRAAWGSNNVANYAQDDMQSFEGQLHSRRTETHTQRSTESKEEEELRRMREEQIAKMERQEEEERGQRDKPKKVRTKRGGGDKENSGYVQLKGKEKDKAKRRQKFANKELDEEEEAAALIRAEEKRLRKQEKAAKKAAALTPMFLPEYITVANLAVALRVRFEEFVTKIQELGFEETSHDFILNAENAGLIAMEYGYEAIIDRAESEDLKAREPAPDPSILPPRPPVVTIMGHVDHGKTTLLDYLRKSSVAATEHGGITQHIGAFSVRMPHGKLITFLDTPGHAAFLNMRQRGADVTDIVILVVAADDSVMPQTIEAINHAKNAKVPIIVAINKIDKDEADIEHVKQDLSRHGVNIEDYGGDTQVVCVSGKTGKGIDELEEATLTLSEILDARSEIDGPAEGWVLEASIKSMGKVATVLVRRGTMRPGDIIVAGQTWARIRTLRNEAGIEIEEAGPGTPVEIDGWREQPLAGDEVLQAPDEDKAKSVVDYRLERAERDKLAEDMDAINDFRKATDEKRAADKAAAEAKAAAEQAGDDEEVPEATKEAKVSGPKEVPFLVKGDVSGSVEAVIDSISALGNAEVRPNIIRSGVGQISEFDVEHAAAAKGHLINFNTSIDPHIASLAEHLKVQILDHNVIYRLVDDVKAEMSKLLAPLIVQRVLGEAEIAQVFEITVKGRQVKNIAGCKVRNGAISKKAKIRVLRGGEKIFDGSLASLKNVKKDVMERKMGDECGMGFEDWFDFQIGDRVQCYEEKQEKRYL